MSDWADKFRVCRVCGEPVNDLTFRNALRRLEQSACSTRCLEKEILERFGCCEKAVQHPCVCFYATTCPEHGTIHNGTHD